MIYQLEDQLKSVNCFQKMKLTFMKIVRLLYYLPKGNDSKGTYRKAERIGWR
jgi:hypothetical protein